MRRAPTWPNTLTDILAVDVDTQSSSAKRSSRVHSALTNYISSFGSLFSDDGHDPSNKEEHSDYYR